ncbi:hypothetical protein FNV43_RR20369 [Rhamnella rubrinervis]|uniref:Protein kinase domain-containing protein n=1 Tax=Rhamnella rubrinervis TaxID=2594499 RepID=A0A8K0E090_9ROSA|nr:hypothetical protein FNV43_RR20369 [Rhamnella rubrinervis]
MGGDKNGVFKPQSISSLSFFFFSLFIIINLDFAKAFDSSPSPSSSPSSVAFSPPDNFLIDCGSSQQTKLSDGRTFKSERETASFLSTDEDIQASAGSLTNIINNASNSSVPSSLPLYLNARIFSQESTYTFRISQTGRHWVRLYFYPLPHPTYNLTNAVFKVTANDDLVLLEDFSVKNSANIVFKEYLVQTDNFRFSVIFKPNKNSFAFINAIEVVSAPDSLISDSATSIPTLGDFDLNGLSSSDKDHDHNHHYALQVSHRLNVGGLRIEPKDDTLSRTWESDSPYNTFPQGSKSVNVSPRRIKFDKENNGSSSLIAPNLVYSSGQEMQDSMTMEPNFNLTWKLNVEQGFHYLIRLHFCDIISKTLNNLYFNVYINGITAISNLDLSTLTGALAKAYYRDFVLLDSAMTNATVIVQVGPSNIQSGAKQAILNGIEVMKMSNKANSLAGSYMGSGSSVTSKMKIVAAVGLAMGVTAMLLLGTVCVRWRKKPQGIEKKTSFTSWLLPLHGSQSSFLSSKSSSRKSSIFGSRKSKSGYSTYFSNSGYFGRFFLLSELQTATQNFDDKTVIGVGGFGKVYLGVLEDGTKLAIKRGNASSEQGVNEFRTEIEMLSKLRHRHLVSLVGFCDEQSEMIVVYEYMANGPLRDHLYGSNLAHLSWKQRLEICIGAARGLHYLHTGAAQGIIHRDVKTTNILLDENFVAKVSDFGLSKAAPTLEQTHVSTAVKGSFGYLDPEYFRRQQLTEKSDVYSFGVVLFEVLCARLVINPALPREQVSLAEWAMKWHRKCMIEKIIDPRIADTINSGSLRKYVEAAEKCLAECGVDRPSMGDVLWNLEYALQLQEASSQIDPPEDKTNIIDVQKPIGVDIDDDDDDE